MDASASGGRARSVISFTRATVPAAIPAAMLAASAHVRAEEQRGRASPSAPRAAISGHFTHQADASTNRTVSGSQRMP
jgi:hypothetical protein